MIHLMNVMVRVSVAIQSSHGHHKAFHLMTVQNFHYLSGNVSLMPKWASKTGID